MNRGRSDPQLPFKEGNKATRARTATLCLMQIVNKCEGTKMDVMAIILLYLETCKISGFTRNLLIFKSLQYKLNFLLFEGFGSGPELFWHYLNHFKVEKLPI